MALSLCSLFSAPAAEAVSFSACEGIYGQQAGLNPYGVLQFRHTLKEEFERLFAMARGLLGEAESCLRSNNVECSVMRKYFFEELPTQLKIYRQTLALSGWNMNFDSIEFNKSPLDMQLKSRKGIGMKPLAPLTPEEAKDVRQDWQRDTDRIFRLVEKEMAKYESEVQARSSATVAIPSHVQEARYAMEHRDWQQILTSSNPWLQAVKEKIHQNIFLLNKKRLVQQAIAHPLLLLIDSPQINGAVLVGALKEMRANLSQAEVETNQLLASATGQFRGGIETSGFHDLIDYYSVVNSALMQKPEFCSLAEMIHKDAIHEESLNAILGLGMSFGALFVAPPLVGFGGAVGLSALYLYVDQNEIHMATQMATLSPQPNTNLRDAGDVVLAKEQLQTDILLTPLTLVGAPTLRISKVLKYIFN